MQSRGWSAGLLTVGALINACGGESLAASAPVTSPASAAAAPAPRPASVAGRARVVPRGASDDDLLEAAAWRVEGLPSLSRDGRYVATVFAPLAGYRAIVDDASPNFNEPNGIAEYPNWVFVIVNVATGASVRRDHLVDADAFDAAQRQRTKADLAALVRARLAEMDRALADGGYAPMPTVALDGRQSADVDGVKLRLTTERLSLLDASGRSRADQPLGPWAGEPLPMGHGFTCLYAPRVEEIALDSARGIAVLLVGQSTSGGDACAGAVNATRTVRIVRLAP